MENAWIVSNILNKKQKSCETHVMLMFSQHFDNKIEQIRKIFLKHPVYWRTPGNVPNNIVECYGSIFGPLLHRLACVGVSILDHFPVCLFAFKMDKCQWASLMCRIFSRFSLEKSGWAVAESGGKLCGGVT